MAISPNTIQTIRERAHIVDIIGEHVSLKRAGRGLVGLCPFHQEKSPSFNVNDTEGFYHCFGCGKHGSVFDFVMELRSWSFVEAVRFLAARAGVEVEETGAPRERISPAEQARRRLVRVVPAICADVYMKSLQDKSLGATAREYLAARGMRPETLDEFLVGYAPKEWQFLGTRIEQRLRNRVGDDRIIGMSTGTRTSTDEASSAAGSEADASPPAHAELEQVMLHLGLVRPRGGADQNDPTAKRSAAQAQGTYDTFRDRVIFPITRSDGVPIAFGGRLLSDRKDAPKYLNSPESSVYSKRRSFFGLRQATTTLRQTRTAFLVEGYMDVLGLWQAGVKGVLATCGTAVTSDHVDVLRRLVDRVVVVFDSDIAGRKAAFGCFETFLNSGLLVSAVLLPDGEDPDTFALKSGPEQVEAFLRDRATPLERFYLDYLVRELAGDDGQGPLSPTLLGKAAERYAKICARARNPVERESLLKLGSEFLGISLAALEQLAERLAKEGAGVASASGAPGGRPNSGGRSTSSQQRGRESALSGSSFRPLESGPAPLQDSGPPPDDTSYDDSYFSFESNDSAPPSGFSANVARRGSESKAGSRAQPPAKGGRSSRVVEAVDRYGSHLIIAVILEPQLAQVIIDLPSLISDGPLASALPTSVPAFIRHIAEERARGRVPLWEEQPANDPSVESWYRETLRQFNIDLKVLEEVKRQASLGGYSATRLMEESSWAISRLTLGLEIEDLRTAEASGAMGDDSFESLVQAKLMKRRNLEQFRSRGKA